MYAGVCVYVHVCKCVHWDVYVCVGSDLVWRRWWRGGECHSNHALVQLQHRSRASLKTYILVTGTTYQNLILSCNELTLKKTFYDDLKVSDQVAFTNCFGHGNPFWATVHVWVWTPPRTHTAWSVCSGAAPSMKSSARDWARPMKMQRTLSSLTGKWNVTAHISTITCWPSEGKKVQRWRLIWSEQMGVETVMCLQGTKNIPMGITACSYSNRETDIPCTEKVATRRGKSIIIKKKRTWVRSSEEILGDRLEERRCWGLGTILPRQHLNDKHALTGTSDKTPSKR